MSYFPRKFYLDDFFDNLVSENVVSMKSDIYEKDDKYHIVMEVPGFSKEDISICMKNGYLTVSASSGLDSLEEDKTYIRRERNYGKYERSFYLGEIVEEEIEASFLNGLLTIVVPKSDINTSGKVIQIKD